MHFWTTGSGRIGLQLTEDQAASGYHTGACDDDISALSRDPAIAIQLAALDVALVASELGEYGAWDDDELADHDQNLQRVLWLACADIHDEPSRFED